MHSAAPTRQLAFVDQAPAARCAADGRRASEHPFIPVSGQRPPLPAFICYRQLVHHYVAQMLHTFVVGGSKSVGRFTIINSKLSIVHVVGVTVWIHRN